MNIVDLLRSRSRVSSEVQQYGSPYYTYQLPVTAAGATSIMTIESAFPQARRYFPLDWLELVNNEGAINLTVVINNRDSFYVPTNVIRVWDKYAIHTVAVTNNGLVDTTLGSIILNFQRSSANIAQYGVRGEL